MQNSSKLVKGLSLAFLVSSLFFACAQMQQQAPAQTPAPAAAEAPAPELHPLEAPIPKAGPVEKLTDLPHPGPPFAQKNRNGAIVLKDFPVDDSGNVDWVKSLMEKKIEPRGSLEGDKPEMPPFPLNVEIPAVGAMPNVIFPHGPHTMWLECGNCHPGIFIMKKGANPISMVKIVNGQYCGRCHGRVAFPISNCNRCHVKPKEETPAAQ